MADQKRSPLLANLALVALSVLLALLLLGGRELGLRASGVGEDRRTSRLKYQQIHFSTLVPGEVADGMLPTGANQLPISRISDMMNLLRR